MRSLMLTGVAALALAAGSAGAQENSSSKAASSPGDEQTREAAMQNAEGAGMKDVAPVDGAFVLRGALASGAPVLMAVGPTGELLALAAPLGAFQAGSPAGDPQSRGAAMQSAEGAGMKDVADMPGAFVLQGMSSTGVPVVMAVSPTGELLALAAPLGAFQPASEGSDEPTAGEPADSGYMATQAEPASPHAWDPFAVEAAMRGVELGVSGAAGQTSEPSE